MSRRRSATLTTVATVATVLTVSSAAGAAKIEVVDGTAVFSAAPGEANDLRAGTRANPDSEGRTLKVTDAGATLTAGAGCEQIDAHNAWCPEPLLNGMPLLVRTGDRNDHVVVDDFFERAVVNVRGEGGNDDLHVGSSVGTSPVVDGGAGDDMLSTATNNAGIPVLRGAGGDDRLALDEARGGQAVGGDGDDRILYTGFSPAPGTLRLDGGDGNDVYTFSFGFVPAAMQAGPGIDTLDQSDLAFPRPLEFNMADCPGCVEIVLGSSLDDIITGDRNSQAIFGGEGDDQLYGGSGPDVISGQDGDDTLTSRDNSLDVVRCGDGDDDTATVDRRDLVSRTCENLVR
jgi:Ca2+-binding RTX toxin-like protein